MEVAYQDVGPGTPDKVNLIIEIQKGGGRNKYEFDKNTGRLTLDRVNATTMGCPADYGYVPGTLCEDGDPLDALLLIHESVVHGVVVPARPIGVLYMIDEDGGDEKLICVPADDITMDWAEDLSGLEHFKKQVEHFYRHYKDWKNNWQGVEVEFKGWGGAEEAKKVVADSIARAKQQ